MNPYRRDDIVSIECVVLHAADDVVHVDIPSAGSAAVSPGVLKMVTPAISAGDRVTHITSGRAGVVRGAFNDFLWVELAFGQMATFSRSGVRRVGAPSIAPPPVASMTEDELAEVPL
jgi:hypothetical protein